jgi:cytochrome c556
MFVMRRIFLVVVTGISLALLVAHASCGLAPRPAAALLAQEKAEVSDFMEVVHGTKGLLGQIRDSMSGGGPADEKAWKAVKARAAILLFLTDTILVKSQPSKGDKASWKEKVADYERLAKALARAADDKDSSAVKSETGKISKSCNACHKAHR